MMLLSDVSSIATPNYDYDDSDDDDDDDEVSVLYSKPPSNNKGKAIQTDYCIDVNSEIQLLLGSSSTCGNKKRKFIIHDDDDEVIFAETSVGKEQLEAKNSRNLNVDDENLILTETLLEKEQLEAKKGRNLNIYDQDLIFAETLFAREQLEAKKVRDLKIYDQDLIFAESLYEQEQLRAKKGKSLAVSDENLIFPKTLFEENQLEAKKWRNLNIDNKELIFVDTCIENDHLQARKARKLSIDDDDADEVEVLYSKHENDNLSGKLSVTTGENLIEKDQLKAKKEGNFDIDAELQLIYSFPDIYHLPELGNIKHDLDNVFGNVGADDGTSDDKEVIFASSSSKGKGILVEDDQLKAKRDKSLTFGDDDEVQVIYSSPKINLGESSKSKHEDDNLLEKVIVDDATGDLSLLIMCEICTDEKPKIDFLAVMGCDHSYCSECVAKYVASKLQENVVEITCPVSECAGVLGPEHCRSILPAEVYDRWGLALCEEIISPSQKFYCPYKDCSALMIDDTQETGVVITRMDCPNCQRIFCVKCKVPWHDGVECVEFQRLNEDERGQEDVTFVNLAKKNLWKRCPKCKMYVQKSHGCNAMRCRCGCSFCYACGSHALNCNCVGGYAHPIGPRFRQVRPMTPHVYRPVDNLPENQNLTNPPDQFAENQVGLRSRLRAMMLERMELRRTDLLNLSANKTQYRPYAHYPQGPGEGSLSNSQARYGLVGDGLHFSQARQVSVRGGLNISQARQGSVADERDNPQYWQDLVGRDLSISQARQDPVGGGPNNSPAWQDRGGGGRNNSEARQSLVGRDCNNSQARQGPVGGGRNNSEARLSRLRSGRNNSNARQGPVGGGHNNFEAIQNPVGGGHNNSEARQSPVEGGHINSQATQGPVVDGLNTSQARKWRRQMRMAMQILAYQRQSSPSNQFVHGPVGDPNNTSYGRELRRRRIQMASENLSTNLTHLHPSSQFGQIRGSGSDNNSLPWHREQVQSQLLNHLQNLSGHQNSANANIQLAQSSTSRTNESIHSSQSVPGTSHVDAMENLSARSTPTRQNVCK